MKKLNNKGFSLVELIIVIAIMAILVGVVGSQVIPYLESSRQSKDLQVFSNWNTSALSAYSKAAAVIDSAATYTIVVGGATAGVSCSTDSSTDTVGAGQIANQFKILTGMDTTNFDFATLESKAGKGVTSVTFEITDGGKINVTFAGSTAAVDAFEGQIVNK